MEPPGDEAADAGRRGDVVADGREQRQVEHRLAGLGGEAGPGGEEAAGGCEADPGEEHPAEGLVQDLGEGASGVGHPRRRVGIAATPGLGFGGNAGAEPAAQEPEHGHRRDEHEGHPRHPGRPPRRGLRRPGERRERHARPGGCRAGQRRDGQRRQRPDGHAGRRQRRHRQEHGARRLVGPGRLRAPGIAQEDRSLHLHEAGRCQRSHQGQRRRHQHREGGRVVEREVERPDRAERHEPLRDEAVQRGEPADGGGAHQEERRRPGHGAGQPAQPLDVAGPGGVLHRARAQEEKRLEEGVVHHVEGAAGEAQQDQSRLAAGPPQHRQAHAHGDDADVLHRVVGQQALEVVLRERQRHAQDSRDRAQDHEHHAPGGRRGLEEAGGAQEAVDPGLEQHPRHHRGDVAGGRGVGAGEPEVERDETGLETESDQREQGEPAGRGAARAEPGPGREVEAAAGVPRRGEEDEDGEGPDVGRGQVDPGGRLRVLPVGLGADQEKATERHHLPREEEEHGVVGEEHEGHGAGDEPVPELQPHRAVAHRGLRPVGEPVDRAQRRDDQDGQQEERRERVEPHRDGRVGLVPGKLEHRGGSPGQHRDGGGDPQHRGEAERARRESLAEGRTPPQGEAGEPARRGDGHRQDRERRAHGLRPRKARVESSATSVRSV